MKVIIAGGRDIDDYKLVCRAIEESGYHISEVVCGMARGVDLVGRQWAEVHRIPVAKFPADWANYGNAAGPIRNHAMAEYAEALILVWDGRSKGSANMLMHAHDLGLKIHQHIVPTPSSA